MDLDVIHFVYIFYILTRIPSKLKCGQVLCEHKHLLATRKQSLLSPFFEKNFSTTFHITPLSRNYSTSIGQSQKTKLLKYFMYFFILFLICNSFDESIYGHTSLNFEELLFDSILLLNFGQQIPAKILKNSFSEKSYSYLTKRIVLVLMERSMTLPNLYH